MENPNQATNCMSCGAAIVSTPAALSPDVKKCSYCGKPLVGEDAYYFKCRYCGQDFCYEHRLPENHLCKSSPLRRNIPNTGSGSYYSTGGGYWSSTGRSSQKQGGSFAINISKQGRNLAIAIVAGLVIGAIAALFSINGNPAYDYLIQIDSLVFSGWVPPLLTSMIVVAPSYLGVLDVVFNAFAVIWLDGLFRASYTAREYYAVFIGTGLVGNILSLVSLPPGFASFGASGGIFGLIAGAVTVDYARNGRFNPQLVIWFLFIFIFSTFTGDVDIFAHLGGAVAGLVAGYYIGKPGTSKRRYY